MFRNISNYFNKKNLKDKKYSFLFDKPLKNEYALQQDSVLQKNQSKYTI